MCDACASSTSMNQCVFCSGAKSFPSIFSISHCSFALFHPEVRESTYTESLRSRYRSATFRGRSRRLPTTTCGRSFCVAASSHTNAINVITDLRSERLAGRTSVSLLRLSSALGMAISPFVLLTWSNFRGDSSILILTVVRPGGARESRKLCHFHTASACPRERMR